MSIVALIQADAAVREQPREADKMLRKLIMPFGGADFFFTGGETPLFLLDLTLPADNETGVNFDIRLAYAMVMLAKNNGAQHILLGVKCASGFSFADVLQKSGYDRLREIAGVEFIDLRAGGTVERYTDTSLVLDKAAIYRRLTEADMLISLAKFKAGEGHLFGGALNNAAIAADLPADFGFDMQQRALIDVYSLICPDLTVIDGLIGDSQFQPQQHDFVMVATDAVAADAVLAAIAGIELSSVEYLQLAAQYGLGVGEPADISIFGDDLSEIMA